MRLPEIRSALHVLASDIEEKGITAEAGKLRSLVRRLAGCDGVLGSTEREACGSPLVVYGDMVRCLLIVPDESWALIARRGDVRERDTHTA